MGIDARRLRNALGCFATGVTVITTRCADGSPVGITVNSFNSVSLEPPLVLFSIADSTSKLKEFLRAEQYAVNILAREQEDKSNLFAQAGLERFSNSDFCGTEAECPTLPGALAVIKGRKYAVHEGGDHQIFIMLVEEVESREDGEPLLFYRGNYADISN